MLSRSVNPAVFLAGVLLLSGCVAPVPTFRPVGTAAQLEPLEGSTLRVTIDAPRQTQAVASEITHYQLTVKVDTLTMTRTVPVSETAAWVDLPNLPAGAGLVTVEAYQGASKVGSGTSAVHLRIGARSYAQVRVLLTCAGSLDLPLAAPIASSLAYVSTVAGTYEDSPSLDPTPVGSQVGLSSPTGVAVDGQGNIYVACQGLGIVRRIAPDGSSTVIGKGTVDWRAINVEAFSELGLDFNKIIFAPQDVACDQDGNVMVTCKEWGLLIFLCQKTGRYFQKDMVAGRGYLIGDHGPDLQYDEYSSYYDTNSAHPDWPAEYLDGPIDQARFRSPHGLCADAHGNFYVADRRNNLIRRINRDDGQVITLAGPLVAGSDGLPPEVDQLNGTDNNGQYLWDGKAAEVEPATASHLYRPFDVAWRSLPNGQEELYIWEGYNPYNPPGSPMVTGGNAIRVLSFSESNLTGGTVRTVAGGPGLPKGDAPDGTLARNASLYLVDGVSDGDIPNGGIAIGGDYLYFCDTNNHKIKMIDLRSNYLFTVAGGGTTPRDADSRQAKLDDVSGLAVDAAGNVLFCDSRNNVVRRVNYLFGRP